MDNVTVLPRFEIVGVCAGDSPRTYSSWLQASASIVRHDFLVLTATVSSAVVNRGTSNMDGAVVTYTGMQLIIEAMSLGELLAAWNQASSGSASAGREVVFPDIRRG